MIVTLKRQVVKRCPYKGEVDVGELVITIPCEPPCEAPELHHLATLIDAMVAEPVSHEKFTADVAARLRAGSTVTTTWNTGPWSVEVQAEAVSA